MKTRTKAFLNFAVVATVVAGISGTAFAQHRHDDVGPGTLSAQFNYGIWTGDSINGVDLNAYAPGLALRGGYTFDIGLYLGADFDYFFGESKSAGFAGIAGASVNANVYDFMAELGYDFWIYRSGVLRPKLGLGLGLEHTNGCVSAVIVGGTCNGDTKNGFAIAPGLQFLHFFDNVYLTAELRYQTVSVSDLPDPSAFIFGVGVGVAL